MTPEQADLIRNYKAPPTKVLLSDWDPTRPRTLVYGYTCDRSTFHVYVDNKAVHLLVYKDFPLQVVGHRSTENEGGLLASMCAPDKRLYADVSDFDFCRFLQDSGVAVALTPGGKGNLEEHAPFHAFTLETVKEKLAQDAELTRAELTRVDHNCEIVDLAQYPGLALKVYNPKNTGPRDYAFCVLLNGTPTALAELDADQREVAKATLKEKFPRHAAALL